MAKKGLTCFNCGFKFKERKDIFRNSLNYPLCKECFGESLEFAWGDEFIESIIEDIQKNFNGNYNRWKKNFDETMELCDGCSGKYYDKMYYPKEMIIEINGKKYCETCIEIMEEKEK
jgi:hypothetical protein